MRRRRTKWVSRKEKEKMTGEERRESQAAPSASSAPRTPLSASSTGEFRILAARPVQSRTLREPKHPANAVKCPSVVSSAGLSSNEIVGSKARAGNP